MVVVEVVKLLLLVALLLLQISKEWDYEEDEMGKV